MSLRNIIEQTSNFMTLPLFPDDPTERGVGSQPLLIVNIYPVDQHGLSQLDGRNESLTDGVQRALGRQPKDFSAFAQDAAATGIWNEQPQQV